MHRCLGGQRHEHKHCSCVSVNALHQFTIFVSISKIIVELRILLDNTMVDIMYLQLQNTCHVSVMGKTVCISTSTVLATVQVASPSGRAVFELRGLPENTTVDLKVCGPIESGGTMSIYRDGAFLWCAIRNVT